MRAPDCLRPQVAAAAGRKSVSNFSGAPEARPRPQVQEVAGSRGQSLGASRERDKSGLAAIAAAAMQAKRRRTSAGQVALVLALLGCGCDILGPQVGPLATCSPSAAGPLHLAAANRISAGARNRRSALIEEEQNALQAGAGARRQPANKERPFGE